MKVCNPIAEAFRGGHRCGNPVEPSNRRGLMAQCRPILGIDRLHAFALGEQGGDFDTLRQALAAAAQRPTETPWIVTLSGKILRPREIQEMIGTLERD